MTARRTPVDEILTRAEGGVRFLILNRPKAINSLTHSMVTAMHVGAAATGSTTTTCARWCVRGAGEARVVRGR